MLDLKRRKEIRVTLRNVTGPKDADPVPLIHGRFGYGYGVPKAKRNSIVLDEVEDNTADYFPAAAPSSVLEEDAASHLPDDEEFTFQFQRWLVAITG